LLRPRGEKEQNVVDETNNGWPIAEYIERARSIKTWQKAQFGPRDAVRYRRSGGELVDPEIIPSGWDHEHCMLCMTKIAQLPDSEPDGYSNQDGSQWLCLACYERYIFPSQR
jgi:hypothetical protein